MSGGDISIARAEVGSVAFDSDAETLARAWDLARADLRSNVAPYRWLDGRHTTPCLMAGEHYRDQPWTRDAAFNAWYAGATCFPVLALQTLNSVLVEDTGGEALIGGQTWDAVIWAQGIGSLLAWHPDPALARFALGVLRRTLAHRFDTEWDPRDGCFRGGACFQDGISAYPDEVAGDSFAGGIETWAERFPERRHPRGEGFPWKALSTNLLYLRALRLTEDLSLALGLPRPEFPLTADAFASAVRARFLRPDGLPRYLVDCRDPQHYQEGLGYAFAILFDGLDPAESRALVEKTVLTPHGIACVHPTMPRYRTLGPHARHSGTLWPHVNAAWGLACLKAGRADLALSELRGLADKAVRDGGFSEIFHPVTGLPTGGLQEKTSIQAIGEWEACHHQSWCATGFQGLLLQILLGPEARGDTWSVCPRLLPGQAHWRFEGLWLGAGRVWVEASAGEGPPSCHWNGAPADPSRLPLPGPGEHHLRLRLSSCTR